MAFLSDSLLIAGVFCAAFYCLVLAGRVQKLKSLDSGLGAAIAALSMQVDGMRSSLVAARNIGGGNSRDLADLTARAEIAAGRLEVLMAGARHASRVATVPAPVPATEAVLAQPLVLRQPSVQGMLPERLRVAPRVVAEKPRGQPAETAELIAALKQALLGH